MGTKEENKAYNLLTQALFRIDVTSPAYNHTQPTPMPQDKQGKKDAPNNFAEMLEEQILALSHS